MSKTANAEDLERELWLRQRNKGEIIWYTKEGKAIPIKDMTDEHLQNTLNYLQRKEELEEHYFEGEAADWESRDRT